MKLAAMAVYFVCNFTGDFEIEQESGRECAPAD
uniref:Uncharacterized protein n=1 Tax=Siphoviridae sp. ctqwO1 TaxID=2826472 RepID=A0A8S5QNC7_9CAUD|nr:MAG TPA: hypothetical protein [Siphoviridae sp. ctqwO1]